MSDKWGGKRKNAGRKRLPDSKKKKTYSFYLDNNEIEFIESFPGNNRSESLRKILNNYKILKKQFDNSR